MEPLSQLFYLQKLVLREHLPLIYAYTRPLKPAKTLIVGPENRRVCKELLERRYNRVHRNYLKKNMKLTSKFEESTVFVVQVLRIQSRVCKEVKDLFLDPDKIVVCCVENPTDLAPEVRRFVNNIIMAGELNDQLRDKLNLCFGISV